MDQMSSMTPANGRDRWDAGTSVERRGSTFEQIKSTVADKLRTAAEALHDKVSQQGGEDNPIAGYGHQAADWLDASANYIRELDPQKIKTDIENQVRRNPGRSLLIAGAAGLLLGELVRRR